MNDRDRVAPPLVELTVARLRDLLREPEMVFWVFVFPILMAAALGVAFRLRGPEPMPVGVASGADAPAAIDALDRRGDLDVIELNAMEIEEALSQGRVHLVVIPGRPPIYRYDPTREESRLTRLLVDEALQRAAGRSDLWAAQEQRIVRPGSRYIDWLIPGLLGMNIMGSGLWGVGFSIVQARARGLLKRLIASPMRREHYLLSHMLARLVFLGLEVGTLVGFGWLVFGVPVVGSFAALVLVAVVGALTFSGLGLLLSSRVRTIEAVSGLMNLVTVPMWIVSGVFFASSNFPEALQPLIQALPLTALIEALRGVMMDGAPLPTLGPQLGLMALWGAGSFVLALRIFRWR